jgi:hypothetical protein
MEMAREKYRKLPGRRRGFLFGSSVWLGSDHLLLVKSARFREDYKRFYFRDIQAIAAAEAPRFHISTRSALIGYCWLVALGVSAAIPYGHGVLAWVVAPVGILLIAAWAYLSAKRSCRCRIYTAVSADELTSLYRTWTLRRFLHEVLPYVEQAQGAVECNWPEEVEERQIGPKPERRTAFPRPGTPAPQVLPESTAAWTPVSTCFVGSLCLGGLADLMSVRAGAAWGHWILLASILLQLATAIAVLVWNYMGKLRPALRNLAVVTLACFGGWYYASLITVTMASAVQNALAKHPNVFPMQTQPLMLFEYPMVRGSAGAITMLLGLVGAILELRGPAPKEEKVTFNV